MGNKVNSSEEIEQLISNIFWFTYRYGFHPVYKFNGQEISTDSGWGCMIRVGQMMIAELLKKHLKNFYNFDIMNSQEYLLEFVQMFNEYQNIPDQQNEKQQNKNPFSIQQIMQIGQVQYSKKPDQWYSPNEIINILDIILKRDKIKMSLGLCFTPIYDNFVDLISITQEMCMNKCSCPNKKTDYSQIVKKLEEMRIEGESVFINWNERKPSTEINIKAIDIIKKELDFLCPKCLIPKKAIAICLLSRIGCDSPNEQYIEMIRILMKKPYFCGVLGGRPKLANFLVGYLDDKFVCMDPHLVQASQKDIISSCFTQNAMFFKMNEIDCSCGLVFYFKDFGDLAEFLVDVNVNFYNSFFSIGTKKQISDNKKPNIEEFEEFEAQIKQYQEELNKYKQDICIFESSISDTNLHQLDQSIQDYSIIEVPEHIHEHPHDHDSSFEQC